MLKIFLYLINFFHFTPNSTLRFQHNLQHLKKRTFFFKITTENPVKNPLYNIPATKVFHQAFSVNKFHNTERLNETIQNHC